MSTAYEGRQRNEALRALSRFEINGPVDHNGVYFYRVRPRGFNTVIAEIRVRSGASNQDLIDIGNAVRTLARVGAK